MRKASPLHSFALNKPASIPKAGTPLPCAPSAPHPCDRRIFMPALTKRRVS
jgi:hypothetical protein